MIGSHTIKEHPLQIDRDGNNVCKHCGQIIDSHGFCSQSCMKHHSQNNSYVFMQEKISETHTCSICNKTMRISVIHNDKIIPMRMDDEPFLKNNFRNICSECQNSISDRWKQ